MAPVGVGTVPSRPGGGVLRDRLLHRRRRLVRRRGKGGGLVRRWAR